MKQGPSTSQDRSFQFLIFNFKLSIFLNRFFFFLSVLIVALAFFIRLHHVTQPSRYIFDEDFHAFTASQALNDINIIFEWWHPPFSQEISQYTYRPPAIEWLHPPVAKYIWIVSIKWLGDNPLAWRLPSVIFGTINVALIIWLTLILTRRQDLSLLVGLILATEKLSITQSQIAMNDVFLTTWLLLATIFYLLAKTKSSKSHQCDPEPPSGDRLVSEFHTTHLKDSEPSIADVLDVQNDNFNLKSRIYNLKLSSIFYLSSSIFLGLTLATKWSAFWVLSVFLIHYLVTQLRNDNSNLKSKIKNKNSFLIFHSKFLIILSSIFLFLILPIVIYLLAYLPLLTSTNGINQFIKLHQEIIYYQTTTNFNHPHASQPWQWTYGQKPVYYALKTNGDDVNRVAQPNSILMLILTGGLLVSLGIIILRIISAIHRRETKSSIFHLLPACRQAGLPAFISLSLWLPWFFVSRPKFIYYMTPVVPFLIVNLMILIQVFFIKNYHKSTKEN